LLTELGYGFALDRDVADQPIAWRRACIACCPRPGWSRSGIFSPGLFNGAELLAMAEADWSVPGALAAAKRLMRQALAPHLGGRPLVSRELFMNIKEVPRD
jgi:DNA repair protein RecO (recombination protein O)